MLADIIPKVAAATQEVPHAYRPRPSSAGPERCIRSLVYHARGEPANPFPGRAMLVFDDSSWHETLTADWIRKTAYRLHSEQMEVETPVGKGKIDGILTDLLGTDRLYEHKALSHFSFERYWKGQWPLDYFTQLALYLVGVRKVQPEITEALLLIKNKNTAAYMEFLLRYDPGLDRLTIVEMIRSDGQRGAPGFTMNEITRVAVEKFIEVEGHAVAGTLPARPFEYGTDYPCGYCRWAETCWDGYEQEFEALATDAAMDKEVEDLCAYYLETSGHASEMEKEKEKLKAAIRAKLAERGIRGGKAGPYLVTLGLRERKGWDEEQIPPDVAARARTINKFEVLTIRKPKEGRKP
jgi:hypothetical protein